MTLLELETNYGNPIVLDGLDLMPVSKSLRIQPRGIPIRLHWERPTGILIKDRSGRQRVMPIEDVTRKAQIAVILLTAAFWLFIRRRRVQSPRR